MGFAATPGLALLAAQATNRVLIATDTESFVSTLPIHSLNPEREFGNILRRWGIHTVGALLALGKEEIAERLGAPALEWFERVSLDCVRPLKIVRPSESFEEEMDFEAVIETAEPLLFVLRRFVEQLAARIALTYRVISELELRLTMDSGALYERTFKIPAPTSRVETLFRMLHTHLENVRTDAPIVSLRLRATPCLDGNHQFGLFESALRDPNQFHETLARLTALLGANRVGTPVREASRKPDAFRMEVPQFGTTEIQMKPAHTREISKGPSLRRFRPRVRATIELREKNLVRVCSAAFTGAICDQRGPFGISGEGWWENRPLRRLEWDVQASDGTLYRLVQQDGEWFVEGVYD
jgi:protein ImuB